MNEYFDIDTLKKIYAAHQNGGSRAAFRACFGLSENKEIDSNDVEDFIVVFYEQYNKQVGLTF